MRKIFLLAFIISFLISCDENRNSTKAFNNLEWLTGNWHNVSEDGIYYETWEKLNDSTYKGESYFMFSEDTVFKEDINIMIKQDTMYYIPIVSNQNKGKPVEFKLIQFENNKFTFENKLHDFPQRIIYLHTRSDSLHAWIEGFTNGNFKKVDFKMGRIK